MGELALAERFIELACPCLSGRQAASVLLSHKPLGAGGESKGADWKPGDQPLNFQPILRQFRAVSDMIMRDGQTIESTLGTDPLTGHIWKAEVTLSVVK